MYLGPNNSLNASFGPGECGFGLLKIALSVWRENGQKKIKRQCQKHTKNEKFKRNTIPVPKQRVQACHLGPGNVDGAHQRWCWMRRARVARKN